MNTKNWIKDWRMAQKKIQRTQKKGNSQQLQNAGIKISEAILRLCEPLRLQYKDHQPIKVIISLTVMAWNISLFPKEEQAKVQEISIAPLLKQLKRADEVAMLLDTIKILIDRKNKDYPYIRFIILKHTPSFLGETLTLTIEASEAPERTKKK